MLTFATKQTQVSREYAPKEFQFPGVQREKRGTAMTQPVSVRFAIIGMVMSLALAGWANKALSDSVAAAQGKGIVIAWDATASMGFEGQAIKLGAARSAVS